MNRVDYENMTILTGILGAGLLTLGFLTGTYSIGLLGFIL